jgi:2-oxoglutarate ferredoxin oxidoreductase subunit beta
VDILQPCVSFNHVNNFAWYKKRCYEVPAKYDPTDFDAAIKLAYEWGDKIPVGVIYRHDRPSYEDQVPALASNILIKHKVKRNVLQKIMEGYY